MRFFLFFCFVSLMACSGPQESEERGVEVTDGLDRKVSFKRPVQQAMALAPSMTEMLFFSCPQHDHIVGRTQNCDEPSEAETFPVVNNYPRLDAEALVHLQPDVVFSHKGITSVADAEHLKKLGIETYIAHYENINDVLKGIKNIGGWCGCDAYAERKADSLQKVIDGIAPLKKKLDVLGLVSVDPLFAFGRKTLFSHYLNHLGLKNVITDEVKQAYPQLSREYVIRRNPDVIFITGKSLSIDEILQLYPEFERVSAFQNKRIYVLDGDLQSRPGPRMAESILEIKEKLHVKK